MGIQSISLQMDQTIIRKAVRENLHFGSTFIKIVIDDQRYIYSVDEIRAAVEEAEGAGTYVAAHCWTEQGARNAIEAGVHTIEHGPNMSDETLAIGERRRSLFGRNRIHLGRLGLG